MTDRELDAEVAEKVMGKEIRSGTRASMGVFWDPVASDKFIANADGSADNIPPYSTDIAAAWQVIEQLGADYYVFKESPATPDWCVSRCVDTHGKGRITLMEVGRGNTAPLAICRAALAAVGQAVAR